MRGQAKAQGRLSARGPVLSEGKLETESVPMAGRPDQGAVQTRVSAALPEPLTARPRLPNGQRPRLPHPEEHEPPSVLGSRVTATSRRVRTPARGPKAAVERGGAPCARSPPCSAPLESPHRGAAPRPDPRGGGAAEEPEVGAAGRACRERWVRRCEGISAPGMRAGDGGAQLGDPVRWPPAAGVQMGLGALS